MADFRFIGATMFALPGIAITGPSLLTPDLPAAPAVQASGTKSDGPSPIQLGTNLNGIRYWSSAVPFVDLMKSSFTWLPQRPGKWNTEEPLDLDEHGWVRSIPAGATIALVVIRETPAAPPNARYLVLFEGEGTLQGMLGTAVKDRAEGRFLIEAADDGAVHLRITETDPEGVGDYIRNIRVVREDQVDEFQSGILLNPAFATKLRGFHVVRYMDWMETNHLYRPDGTTQGSKEEADLLSVEKLRWADRPTMDDARWDRGVPVEAMVQLANENDVDPWFNMPVNASDDYVRNFALYVREHLEPEREVRVELSNEVWNWSFIQANYAQAHAVKEFGPGTSRMEWYGKRTAEVGAIWNEVFDEPVTGTGDPGRVRVVYSTQFFHDHVQLAGLETKKWVDAQGRSRRAADYFDEYAIAPYYQGGMQKAENTSLVKSWWALPDGGYEQAFQALWTTYKSEHPVRYSFHGAEARRFGLDLVTYEAGYGELTPYSEHGNQKYTDFLVSVQRRPEIYDLEIANMEQFAEAGGTLYTNFGLVGAAGKAGSWSVLETMDQETSPRYRALQEMMRRSKENARLNRSGAVVSVSCRTRLIGSLGLVWKGGGLSGASDTCGGS